MADLASAFAERFQTTPLLYRAPGRINLLGEHIDYHDGFVMPAAIHFQVDYAIAKRDEKKGTLIARDLNESFEYDLETLAPGDVSWANYLLGVMYQLRRAGHEFPAVDVMFSGNIPPGAGLSSSAAVECGLAYGLNDLFGLGIDSMSLAKLSQAAEHTFAGVQCGLMDQFASVFGQEGQVMCLDCRSLEYEYFPFPSQEWKLLLMDTRVKHALSDGGYNQRRQESEAGLAAIQAKYPEVKSLRDATFVQLESVREQMEPVSYRRCSFVLDEIQRVGLATAALKSGDITKLGELMYLTHHGLQHDYEVSCIELDFLVAMAKEIPTISGARMMGGGFGGCTINLIPAGSEEEIAEQLRAGFVQQFGHEPGVYITQISQGASKA